jgi:hypothetical protein
VLVGFISLMTGSGFREAVCLERGPLSLVSTTEELLGRKSSGSGLENRNDGRRDPSHCPCDTLYPQKLALTSPTSGSRSVCIIRSRTQATEFSLVLDESLGYMKGDGVLFQLSARHVS